MADSFVQAGRTHGQQSRHGNRVLCATDDVFIAADLALQQGEVEASCAVRALRLRHLAWLGDFKFIGFAVAAMRALYVEGGTQERLVDIHDVSLQSGRSNFRGHGSELRDTVPSAVISQGYVFRCIE
ncbi:hypothetical protein ACVBEH_04875, partial [Roseateles sp. GG27B]